MKIIGLIQARMGSSRLPGKVMMPLVNKPILWHILQRMKKVKLISEIILATSFDKDNDILEEFANKNGIICHRFEIEDDLISRIHTVSKKIDYDIMVKVNADCPLIDFNYINDLLSIFIKRKLDFASNKLYRLEFTSESGLIEVKGTEFDVPNANGVTRAETTQFVPYIRREVGFEYTLEEVALKRDIQNGAGESEIIKGDTPPNDNTKLWFNTEDNIMYYYDTNSWLSEQIFSVDFNDQGTTPNNTFLRVGNTVTNDLGTGYNLPFNIRVKGISFSRLPGTANYGNFWLYSNEFTGTDNASVINVFLVPSTARGYVETTSDVDISTNNYMSLRWNGNQTNNNIVTLQYRKKYI